MGTALKKSSSRPGPGEKTAAGGRDAPAFSAGVAALNPLWSRLIQRTPGPGATPVQAAQPPQPPVQPAAPPGSGPVKLQGSVGDGGANDPVDVRAVQDRLLFLGALSAAAYTAELVTPPAPAPAPTPTPPGPGSAPAPPPAPPVPAPTPPPASPAPAPQPIAATTIPLTIAAIGAFAKSAVGQPLLLLTPGSPLAAALNATPVAAQGSVVLTGTVGIAGANALADVQAVMDRLLAVGYLDGTDHGAESAAIANLPGAVPDATIPRALAALLRRLREGGSASATQVAPASLELQILNAPAAFAPAEPNVGALVLSGSVGAGGANRKTDVAAIQDRLLALSYLSRAAYNSEKPGRSAPAVIPEASLAATVAAILRFEQEALGPAGVAGGGLIAPGSPALLALNAPPRVQPATVARGNLRLGGSVGENGANAPADAQAVQDRLLEIGLLAPADHTRERVVIPAAGPTPPPAATLGAATLTAIRRFHREVLGGSLALIRPGADEAALNQPPRFRAANFDLRGSVGTQGTNQAAEVRTIQERLHDLGLLATPAFRGEAVDPAGTAPIPDASLPLTIAAISSFQTSSGRGRIPVTGRVDAGSVTHRQLLNPVLPPPLTATFASPVGRGAVNDPADVLTVQARLQELGFLTAAAFLAERPAAGATSAVPVTQLPQTIAAIDVFVGTAGGTPPNGRIVPASPAGRALRDPTYGTRSTINPNALDPAAGPAVGPFSTELQHIIDAVEIIEAGSGGRGERPAELQNAAGTPASFGKSQLVAATAVETLVRNPAIAGTYGLDRSALSRLNTIGSSTVQRYDAIYALVPAPGMTEAHLQTAIATYIANQGAAFHRETGLFDSDITTMFRLAQLRRHLAVVRTALPAPGAARDAAQEQAATDLMDARSHPNEAANISALGFSRSAILHYVRRPEHLGENRQGFATRALLSSQHGQQLRNAMTDNSGTAIGQQVVSDAFALVRQREAGLRLTLTSAQRAEVTARTHNSGRGTVNESLNNLTMTHNDLYVVRFRRVWVAPP